MVVEVVVGRGGGGGDGSSDGGGSGGYRGVCRGVVGIVPYRALVTMTTMRKPAGSVNHPHCIHPASSLLTENGNQHWRVCSQCR